MLPLSSWKCIARLCDSGLISRPLPVRFRGGAWFCRDHSGSTGGDHPKGSHEFEFTFRSGQWA